MKSTTILALSLLTAACVPQGSFDGKLIDPLTGKARGGVELVATSPLTPNPNCMELRTTTGTDGSFLFEGLCSGSTYSFSTMENSLRIPDQEIPGGVPATEQVEVLAYRTPAPHPDAPPIAGTGQGIYLLQNDKLGMMKTRISLGRSKLWESNEEVVYPDMLPKTAQVIDKGQVLVLAGAKYTERMELLPLLQSDRRKFGNRKAPERSEPWWYAGIEFESDTEWTRRKAKFDESKVIDVVLGGHPVRYLKPDCVPNGFYVMFGKKDRRMYMFNFGPKLKAPGEE